MSSGTLKVTTPSDTEIVMTRVFDAPRRLVWDAYTRPEIVKRWAGGPPGHGLIVCEIDLRVGGRWRWVVQGPNGQTMGLGGRYLEIVAPERFVSTDEFDEPWYEGEATSTVELEKDGKQTRLKQTVRYASKAARDFVLRTPATGGVESLYDRLADELASGPAVLETAAISAAVVHVTVPRDQIQSAMQSGLAELRAKAGEPTGPWFTRHLRMPSDVFDFEIGIPVTVPVAAEGRVMAGGLPAARVARVVYRGPYDGLGPAWGGFMGWVKENGHRPVGEIWERYVDEDEPATELLVPLAD